MDFPNANGINRFAGNAYEWNDSRECLLALEVRVPWCEVRDYPDDSSNVYEWDPSAECFKVIEG